MPYLEEIELVHITGLVQDVRDFESKKNGMTVELRVYDGRTRKAFRLQATHDELAELKIDPHDVDQGSGCRIVAERVVLTQGERAGQSFLKITSLELGKPGERLLDRAREDGVSVPARGSGMYESAGARLDAKLNGAVPAAAGVGADDDAGPF